VATTGQKNDTGSLNLAAYICTVIFIATVFIIFPCRQYFSDGLVYAYDIETSLKWIIHPHHPLFPLAPQFVFRQLGGLQAGISGLGVLLAWSTVFGILACLGILSILRTAKFAPATVLGGVALFAFSHGTWYFSTTPNQNSTALAMQVFSLISLLVIFRKLPQAPSRGEIIVAGFITSLALLASQLNAVLLLPFFYVLLLGDTPSNVKAKNVGVYMISIIIIGGGFWMLLAIGLQGVGTWKDFAAWQQSYITSGHYWASDLRDSLTRTWHGAPDLHLAYLHQKGSLFGGMSENIGSKEWFKWVTVSLAQLVVLLFIIVETVRGVYRWIGKKLRLPIQNIGLLIALPIMLFSFVFTPEWINYRILYLPGFLLFLAPVLERDFLLGKPRLRTIWPLLLIIISLLFANFTVKFLPGSNPGRNPFLMEAKQLDEQFGRHDRIFFISSGEGDLRIKYTRYFTECSVTRIIDLVAGIRDRPGEVEAFFREGVVNGGSVVVHEDAISSPEAVKHTNDKYGIDIQPNEVGDFFKSHFRLQHQLNIRDEVYFVFEPLPGYAGA